MEKFEEQNLRFMQCGKELGEAHEQIDKLEAQIEELTEEKRILIARLKVLQCENIGEKASPSGLKGAHDNMSQKTGIMS